MVGEYDINLIRGTAAKFTFVVSGSDHVPVDVHMYKVTMEIRRSPKSDPVDVLTSVNGRIITSAEEGDRFTVVFTSENTRAIKAGTYMYDVTLSDDDDVLNTRFKVLYGVINVLPEVTQI